MNLHALRIFCEVSRRGGVTRAAEALHISQPAVTAQLRTLERVLGLTLIAPKGRGILLTEAGELVAKKAERLFSLERELERGLTDYKEGRAGRLRLVSTFLPAHYLLPQALARFKTLYPEVKASLQTANSRKAAESLLRYEADAAVIGGAGSWEADGLTGEPLLDDEWWFIVPKHHRLAGKRTGLAEMLEEDFVMREAGSSGREMLLAVGRMYGTKAPRAGLEVNGPGEAIRTVASGYGAHLVSALEAAEPVSRGEVSRVYVEEELPVNPIALYTREGEDRSPAVEHFIEVLREVLTGRLDRE